MNNFFLFFFVETSDLTFDRFVDRTTNSLLIVVEFFFAVNIFFALFFSVRIFFAVFSTIFFAIFFVDVVVKFSLFADDATATANCFFVDETMILLLANCLFLIVSRRVILFS